MTSTLIRFACLACCLGLILPLAAGEETGKDTLIRDDGKRVHTHVIRELREHLEHKIVMRQSRPQEARYRELRGIRYAEMDHPGGYWQRARTFQRDGNWAKAAQYYKQLYDSYRSDPTDEWRGAYGLYGVGLMLERLGRYTDSEEVIQIDDGSTERRRTLGAASIWAAFVKEFPEHRLMLNAMYHGGVSYAKAEQFDQAEEIMEQLKELSRGRAAREAESRMRAVEAMVVLGKGSFREASRRARSVRFRFENDDRFIFGDKDIWLHWSRAWGDALEAAEQWEDAARHYEDVLEDVANDPDKSPELLLKVAAIQIRAGDEDAALHKLLRLDVLPIGGRQQQAEARLQAVDIMLDQVGRLDDEIMREERLAAVRNMLDAVSQREQLEEEYLKRAMELRERLPQPADEEEEGAIDDTDTDTDTDADGDGEEMVEEAPAD